MGIIRKDLIVFSIIAGGIGTLVKTLVTGIPFLLHWTNNTGILIAGKVIFNANKFPLDAGHFIIGFIGHLGFGAMLGIGLSLVYLAGGTDFGLTKGAFYGIGAWLVIRSILISAGMPGEPNELNIPTAAVSLVSHLVYGITTGWVIIRFNRFLPNLKKD
jgi:hypothetical protein